MTEKTIKVCDNAGCGKDITHQPYMKITIHAHHERKIDLCLSCYDTLRRWLEPNMVAPGRDRQEIEDHRDQPTYCPACGTAVPLDEEGNPSRDKSGHLLYGSWLSFKDFERIVLSLGASSSDVKRLWPSE